MTEMLSEASAVPTVAFRTVVEGSTDGRTWVSQLPPPEVATVADMAPYMEEPYEVLVGMYDALSAGVEPVEGGGEVLARVVLGMRLTEDERPLPPYLRVSVYEGAVNHPSVSFIVLGWRAEGYPAAAPLPPRAPAEPTVPAPVGV